MYSQRQSLVVDSGFRCHLTSFARATATAPSAFVARLRKFLRTRRVTAVSQLGTDRIVEIQFSDGQYRLFLEFYASGNLVLTDKDLSILAVFRIVNDGPERERARVGLKYSVDHRQNFQGIPPVTEERVRAALQASVENADSVRTAATGKPRKKAEGALRRAIATSLNEFTPTLIEHAFCVSAFDATIPITSVLHDDTLLARLVMALNEARKTVDSMTSIVPCPGYIIASSRDTASFHRSQVQGEDPEIDGRSMILFDDFHPFLPSQVQNDPHLSVQKFASFNKAVDEFFSSVESQRLETRLSEREENAKRKISVAKQDHEKRLGGLKTVQELNVRKAQAIVANLERVQEVIAAVNSLVAKGIDWMEIARLIELEKERHNAVAETIKLPLKLHENTATLLLAEEAVSEDEDLDGDQTGSDVSDSDNEIAKPESALVSKRLAVDVDLALSPFANARQYYEQRKSAAVKEQKTLQSSEKALRNTEKKINADLKKGLKQEKELMRPQRKAFWFEKFIFFISSEGYLCLGGKDAQQDEILYKNYLKKGDVYIHADLQDATVIIVKNKPGNTNDPIPPSTLSQAGTLAVSTSSAWNSKAVFPAWWVAAEQVAKTSSSGEYLQTGKFQINGEKNFLPPAQLLLGFGVVFRIDEESKARHHRHRVLDGQVGIFEPARKSLDQDDESTNEAGRDGIEVNLGKGTQHADAGISDPAEASEDDTGESDSDPDNDPENEHNASSEAEVEHDNPLQPEGLLCESSQGGTNALSSGSHHGRVEDEIKTDRSEQLHGLVTAAVSEDSPLPTSSYDNPQEEVLDRESEDTASPPAESDQSSFPAEPIPGILHAPHVRGKHGKRIKLKTKYADQDAEDRARAMRLLGSDVAQKKAQEEEASKAHREQELDLQKQRRQRQHAIMADKGKEAEKLRRSKFEEGAATLEADELEVLSALDAFVGAPLPGDEILDAIVMCGPWGAMSRCNWRVKLQPGTVKKGKAVREILQKWAGIVSDREKKKRPGSGDGNDLMLEEEKVRKREEELIRGFRETEVVGVVPVGKVRIMMGPGEGSARGKRGAGAGKGKRGGKGSKKQR